MKKLFTLLLALAVCNTSWARRKVIRTQGKENAFWVILDYGDVVVHVFQTPYRAFYRLEDLWADAERTVYED